MDPVGYLLARIEYVDGHWLWTGRLNRGYGMGQNYESAHRQAYRVFVGPIPPGLYIRHGRGCPKRCINPDHLTPGTPKQNTEDLYDFGNPKKLRSYQVLHIRYSRKTRQELADLYGISSGTINAIQKGRAWKQLTLLSPTAFPVRSHRICTFSKLSVEQVLEIKNSKEPRKELAIKYNVRYGTIGQIQRGESWKSITCPQTNP